MSETSPPDTEPSHASGGLGRSKLGHYTILRRLGRGGMGEVFLARDQKLGRQVAVKVLRGDRAGPELRARFEREAAAVSRLEHPGIVPIYELAEDDGIVFFVMRYVEGVPLSTWSTILRQRDKGTAAATRTRLTQKDRDTAVSAGGSTTKIDTSDEPATIAPHADISTLLGIFEKVAEALHFAHERGVIHRDVKPSNIMIDRDGRPHLLDFGLAKFVGTETLTAADQMLGTLPYMAPEQVTQRSKSIDQRTDVYGLGVTLFECLCGVRPFSAETSEALMFQIVMKDPPSPRTIDPSLSEDLATVCLTCLEKDPQRRYPTAKAMGDDIARLLSHRRIEAKAVGRFGRIVRRAKRSPFQSGLVAALFLSIVVVTFLLVQKSREEKRYAPYRAAVARARDLEKTLEDRKRSLDLTKKELEEAESTTPRHAKPDDARKKSLFDLEIATRKLADEIAGIEAEIELALLESREPAEPIADAGERNAIYFELFLDAEKKGDAAKHRLFEKILASTEYADRLTPRGSLRLVTDPAGAQVTARRCVETLPGVLSLAKESIDLGRTPIDAHGLEAGSYVLSIVSDATEPIEYPVLIERDETWGDAASWQKGAFQKSDWSIKLPKKGAFDSARFAFVAAGPYRATADRRYRGPSPLLEWRWEESFVIARRETTLADYAKFLKRESVRVEIQKWYDAQKDQRTKLAPVRLPFVPRLIEVGAPILDIEALVEDAAIEPNKNLEDRFDLAVALGGVSHRDIIGYALSLKESEGAVLRLPTASQWEKAARGVDGRLFPWGNGFDWSFTSGRYSQKNDRTGNEEYQGKLARTPGLFPIDVSPYGILDMGGNVAEWLSDGPREEGFKDVYWYVGGSFAWPEDFFYAWTTNYAPYDYVTECLGFRWVMSEP